jgi:hypothetical protein
MIESDVFDSSKSKTTEKKWCRNRTKNLTIYENIENEMLRNEKWPQITADNEVFNSQTLDYGFNNPSFNNNDDVVFESEVNLHSESLRK